jgi:uncharacterized glyoxalase superfamily protein PhnB
MSHDWSSPPGRKQRAMPESFRGRALMASLTVKDLQKSLAWYHEVVGFTIDQRYEREGQLRAVALKAGRVRILIGQDDGAKGFERTKGEGLSLTITTAQSVDELARRVKDRGGSLEAEPSDTPWGGRIFRMTDPDGFRVAISSELPRSRQ